MKAPIAPARREVGRLLILIFLLIFTLSAASAGAQPQFNIIYNLTGVPLLSRLDALTP